MEHSDFFFIGFFLQKVELRCAFRKNPHSKCKVSKMYWRNNLCARCVTMRLTAYGPFCIHLQAHRSQLSTHSTLSLAHNRVELIYVHLNQTAIMGRKKKTRTDKRITSRKWKTCGTSTLNQAPKSRTHTIENRNRNQRFYARSSRSTPALLHRNIKSRWKWQFLPILMTAINGTQEWKNRTEKYVGSYFLLKTENKITPSDIFREKYMKLLGCFAEQTTRIILYTWNSLRFCCKWKVVVEMTTPMVQCEPQRKYHLCFDVRSLSVVFENNNTNLLRSVSMLDERMLLCACNSE